MFNHNDHTIKIVARGRFYYKRYSHITLSYGILRSDTVEFYASQEAPVMSDVT